MPVYEHACKECDYAWIEEYSLELFAWMKKHRYTLQCPSCTSSDTFRCINRVATHFKGGGWSKDGYYKYEAYDQLQREGKKVDRFERKEDLERVMKGERAEAAKARLLKEDVAAKRAFGPDVALTDAQAQRRIQKEVDKVKA
jgi:predicted nucleic acid-binding Zn ribbon protein